EIIESSLLISFACKNIDNENEANENETSSNKEPKFVLGYKLFIKLSDGTSLLAKWFEESFKAEYSKLTARKSDIGIYITITQPSIFQNK
ncbi:14456_t:CDS:2, partial [Dentiscutata heterogama]